jgi:hypothetical protein
VTSLVITLQGDRLDPTTAQVAKNYVITWAGPDHTFGTADDQVLVPSAGADGEAVLYDPGANVDIATGRQFPTAVRQTVTLTFADPMPAGNYEAVLKPGIQTAPYSSTEGNLLADPNQFTGHPVASVANGKAVEGSNLPPQTGLVQPSSGASDFAIFASKGTQYLTEFHDNIGALLDALVTQMGDDPGVTQALLDQGDATLAPGITGTGSSAYFLVFILDPVSLNLVDPQGQRAVVDLKTNTVTNAQPKTYIDVGGNVELLVLADVAGTFGLTVGSVHATARGGALIIGPDGTQSISITDQLRAGVSEFTFTIPSNSLGAGPLSTAGEVQVASTGGASGASGAGTTTTSAGGGNTTASQKAPNGEQSQLAFELAQGHGGTFANVTVNLAPVNISNGTGGQFGGNAGSSTPTGAIVTAGGADDATSDGTGNLDIPSLLAPVKSLGTKVIESIIRRLGAMILLPPPPAPPPPKDEVFAPPVNDQAPAAPVEMPAAPVEVPAVAIECPVAPTEQAQERTGVHWAAALLGAVLVPIWREVRARGVARPGRRGEDD